MRALVITDFGSAPEVLEVDTPEPAKDEVRIRVHAASVNGFDLAVAKGYLKGMMEHHFPVILGKDFAGTVDAVGADVTEYSAGDRVFGVVTKPSIGEGSFAEFVTVPTRIGLARLPDSVDFADAAALGLAGTAAVDAVAAARLEPGQNVLIAGATGGVGNQAIQLATEAGAHVIATAHTDAQKSHVLGLGAAETVDYTGDLAAEALAGHPEGFDVVLQFAGDAAQLLTTLRPGGTLVSTIGTSPDQFPDEDATVVPVYANPVLDTLEHLAENQASGATHVPIQHIYALEDATEALTDFADGTLGKLVITTD